MRMDRKKLLLVGVAVLALLGLIVYSNLGASQLEVLDEIGGPFTLTGEGGKQYTREDFTGKVVMLTFGFTNCPDVCPTTLFSMKRLRNKLSGPLDRFQVLFVTLDPERDPPDHLAKYVSHFGEGILGLGGDLEHIEAIAKAYKTKFFKRPLADTNTYTIAHSDFMYLLDGKGRTRGIYHHNEPLEKIIQDAQSLLEEL